MKTFWTRRNFIKSGLLVSFSALVLDALWFEKFFIETKHYALKAHSGAPLGLKFIQISDLHLKSVNSQLKRLAKKINTLNPELIMLTGDAVEGNLTRLLKNLKKVIAISYATIARPMLKLSLESLQSPRPAMPFFQGIHMEGKSTCSGIFHFYLLEVESTSRAGTRPAT